VRAVEAARLKVGEAGGGRGGEAASVRRSVRWTIVLLWGADGCVVAA